MPLTPHTHTPALLLVLLLVLLLLGRAPAPDRRVPLHRAPWRAPFLLRPAAGGPRLGSAGMRAAPQRLPPHSPSAPAPASTHHARAPERG